MTDTRSLKVLTWALRLGLDRREYRLDLEPELLGMRLRLLCLRPQPTLRPSRAETLAQFVLCCFNVGLHPPEPRHLLVEEGGISHLFPYAPIPRAIALAKIRYLMHRHQIRLDDLAEAE